MGQGHQVRGASKKMPPWFADPHYGKFANDASLSQRDIDTLAAWVDAGAPPGDVRDLPAPRQFVAGWSIPKPDVIFQLPKPFPIPAAGVMEYQYVIIRPALPRTPGWSRCRPRPRTTAPFTISWPTSASPARQQPMAVAVNDATNKAYVVNHNSSSVTVLNGQTRAVVATVKTGSGPEAIAINPRTNRIYTANSGEGSVTVIDGNTNTVAATVRAGQAPRCIAVNPVTYKIYTVNYGSGDSTEIDGATSSATSIPTGKHPWVIAIDSRANKTYVVNEDSAGISIINGTTHPGFELNRQRGLSGERLGQPLPRWRSNRGAVAIQSSKQTSAEQLAQCSCNSSGSNAKVLRVVHRRRRAQDSPRPP